MHIYILLLCLLSIPVLMFTNFSSGELQLKFNKIAKPIFWFLIFLLILVQGLRDVSVGGDLFESYQYRFVTIGEMSWASVFSNGIRYELGFVVFTKIMFLLSNLRIYLFVIAGFYLICLGKLILKYSNNIFFSLFLFFALYLFNVSMNNLRSTIALGFIYLAIPYLIEKKYIKFLIFILLAMLFHVTTFAFVLLLFLVLIKDNFHFFVITLVLNVTVYLGFDVVVILINKYMPQYAHYFEGAKRGGGMLMLFVLLFVFYVFFISRKPFFLNRVNIVFYKMLCCAITSQILALNISFIARVSNYFLVSLTIILPNLTKDTRIDTNKGKGCLLIATMVLFWAYYLFVLPQDSTATLPYKFMF